jgi:hypothetical protein
MQPDLHGRQKCFFSGCRKEELSLVLILQLRVVFARCGMLHAQIFPATVCLEP